MHAHAKHVNSAALKILFTVTFVFLQRFKISIEIEWTRSKRM